jgi:hypothetical protein
MSAIDRVLVAAILCALIEIVDDLTGRRSISPAALRLERAAGRAARRLLRAVGRRERRG